MSAAAHSLTAALEAPPWFDLPAECMVHGWRELAPFDWDGRELSLAAWISGQPFDLRIVQRGKRIHVQACASMAPGPEVEDQVIRLTARVLGLDRDVQGVHEHALAAGSPWLDLVEAGYNRLLCAPTLFEDAAKVLCTTNCSWAMTRRMCAALCREPLSEPAPSGRCPFPGPGAFSRIVADDLRKLAPVGYRAGALVNLARCCRRQPDLGLSGADVRQMTAVLNALPGFGPYAVTHLLILLGRYHAIPVDSMVRATVGKRFGVAAGDVPAFLEERYRPWGRFAWWGFRLEMLAAD